MNTILISKSRARLFVAAVASAAILASSSAQAATKTWNQAGGGDFNTAGNWTTSGVPVAADTGLFNIAISAPVTLSANATPGSLSFDTNVSSFTLGTVGGNTITGAHAGSISMLSTLTGTAKTVTVNAPIVLGSGSSAVAYTFQNTATDATNILVFGGQISGGTTGASTLTLTGSNLGNNSINGNIINGSGTVAVTKVSTGTWVLAGTNTYTGATSINGGIVTLSGSLTGSNVTTGSSTSLFSQTSTGFIAGAGVTFTQGSTGTTSFSGTNTYTGATTVNRGILKLDFSVAGAPATNVISSSSALVLGGGTLNLTGKASTSNSQTVSGTTVAAGDSSLSITNATANPTLLALGALTHSVGGSVNFTQATGTLGATNGFTTTTDNTNNILGGWATVGGTDWAANNGTNIVAFTGYTATSTAGTTAANYLHNNINVDSSAGTLGSVITANSLRFNTAAANTVTLAAGMNTIESGGILVTSNVGNSLSTITGGTLVGAAGTDLVVIQNNTGNGLSIASVIADNGGATGLAKSGTGTLTLNNANTYTGASTVNAGVLNIQNATALGTTAGGTSVASGATLQIQGGITVGAEALTLNGNGTTPSLVNVSDANIYGGLLTLGSNSTISANSGSLALSNAGTITGSSLLTVTGSGNGSIASVIGIGTGSFTKTGTGTWTLTGANTYTGVTTVSGGTLDLGGGTPTGSISSSSSLTLGNSNVTGGTLNYTTTGTTTQTFNNTTLSAGASAVNAAVSTGTVKLGTITRSVGGTVDFTGLGSVTTSSGNTNGILGGWATVHGTDWAVANGTGSAITALGSYTATSSAGTTASNYLNNNINVNSSEGTLGGVITANSLRFNTAGADTVTLAAGTNTIASGGILVTSTVGNNLSTITGGTLVGASGKDLVVIQNNTSNGLTIASIIANNTSATGLTKSGAGTLTLNNANTYTGGTRISGGTLKLGSATALGAGAVTIAPGATLDLNGLTPTGVGTFTFSGGLTNSNSSAATWTFSWTGTASATNTIDGTGDITLSGVINTGRLIKNGINTLTIAGSSSNTGTTLVANSGTTILNNSGSNGALRGIDSNGNVLTVNGGTVQLGASNQILASAYPSVSTGIVAVYGGTFDINSNSNTINGLQIGATDGLTAGNVISTGGAGTLTVTGGTTAFGQNVILATNGTVSAKLAGTGATFTKTTNGAVTLSGANTYTGTTTVSVGTLIINGTQTGATGAVSVLAGATLGGNGTMGNSTTTLTTGSTTSVLSPGDGGAGKLTIGGAASFASGATFKMGLGAATTPGTTYDQFVIGGSISGSTAAAGLQFDFSNIGGAQSGTPYTILTFGSILSNFDETKLSMINSAGFVLDTSFDTNGWKINGATELQVQFSAVPEPTTWALLAAVGTFFMVMRRRRA